MRARWIGGLEHVGLGREGLKETDPLLGEGNDAAALGNTYSTFVASDQHTPKSGERSSDLWTTFVDQLASLPPIPTKG
jgi:hypothetical protein